MSGVIFMQELGSFKKYSFSPINVAEEKEERVNFLPFFVTGRIDQPSRCAIPNPTGVRGVNM